MNKRIFITPWDPLSIVHAVFSKVTTLNREKGNRNLPLLVSLEDCFLSVSPCLLTLNPSPSRRNEDNSKSTNNWVVTSMMSRTLLTILPTLTTFYASPLISTSSSLYSGRAASNVGWDNIPWSGETSLSYKCVNNRKSFCFPPIFLLTQHDFDVPGDRLEHERLLGPGQGGRPRQRIWNMGKVFPFGRSVFCFQLSGLCGRILAGLVKWPHPKNKKDHSQGAHDLARVNFLVIAIKLSLLHKEYV